VSVFSDSPPFNLTFIIMLDTILRTLDSRRQQSLAGLTQFLSIPSISAKPQSKPDMQRCAQWVVDQFSSAGLQAQVMPTGGHPLVLAKNKHQPGRPTVLLYGHYDVQPPEPLEQWTTPPFEPTIRNGAIYARGSTDDKGQVWAHIEAISAWQAHGGLPVNITAIIEGEEEIGSENLESFVRQHRDELRADIAVISDTDQFAKGLPAITYGLRGLVYMQVTLTGADHDVHSGLYGGVAPNPANELCKLLGTLHDSQGRVNIPGFYDDVEALSPQERHAWAKLPFDEKHLLVELRAPGLTGETGYTPIEREWARPTLDINGITSGYQGPGAKTIIPSTASAKVSMRLVPHQDPIKIRDAFAKALQDRCPKNVKLEVACHSQTAAVLVPHDSPAMQLAADAMEIGFGIKPTLIRGGGSIPVVLLFKNVLAIDTLLAGFGLPDDRAHSPNEKFELDALHGGTRTAAALYEKLAGLTY